MCVFVCVCVCAGARARLSSNAHNARMKAEFVAALKTLVRRCRFVRVCVRVGE